MPLYGYLVSKDSFLYCCGKPFHLTRLIGTPANAHIDTFFFSIQQILYKVMTESIWKLSNFDFQWTKTLYQKNFKHIAYFFTLFEG